MANDWVRIRRALLSVSDKAGIVELAQGLAALNVELISTGGTYRALTAAGLAVVEVSAITGFPEIMDGRVKTLHPKIHGAILGRANVDDAVMREHAIAPIDLVIGGLYPFERTAASGAAEDDVVEQIDIGGPAMLRAAAKNFARVTVVTHPDQYGELLATLQQEKAAIPLSLRKRWAAMAFAHTARYDRAIADWLAQRGPRG